MQIFSWYKQIFVGGFMFGEWNFPENYENGDDLVTFANENKYKFVNVVKNEMQQLGSVKVVMAAKAKFEKVNVSEDGNEEVVVMEHYFGDNVRVFQNASEEEIKEEYENFVDRVNGEIENWSEAGSGWEFVGTEKAYVKVARYEPLRGGTYIPLPPNLRNKKAIIDVQNRKDNECLKWSLRAALFPAPNGKHALRTSSYPTNDGINYEEIDFPTPVKLIDELEAQNKNLAINVFGWTDRVIVYRLSTKDKFVPRINLMLTELGYIRHYSYVKSISALLYDQTRHNESKHSCLLCLTGFSKKGNFGRTRKALQRHKRQANENRNAKGN